MLRVRPVTLAVVLGGFLGAASSASALTLGNAAQPIGSTPGSCGGAVAWQPATDPSYDYAVPAGGGTITSWSTNTSALDTAGTPVTLLVLRPSGSSSYTVVGFDNETFPTPLPTSSLVTFNVAQPITVAGGDLLGLYSAAGFDCAFSGGPIASSDVVNAKPTTTAPTVGTQYMPTVTQPSALINVSANLVQSQDAGVTAATTPSAIVTGGAAAYTFTVTNNGPGSGPITFTDQIPAGLRVLAAVAGPGNCTIATGQAITCPITGLAPGSATQVVIVALSLKAGSFPDSATVGTSVPDPNASNNSARTTLSVTPALACRVITLAGAPLSVARSVISTLNCRIGKTTKKASKKIAKGDVISTSPGAGQTLGVGTKVNIVESSGPPKKKKTKKKTRRK